MLVVAMILSTAGFAAAATPSDVIGEPCEEAVAYLMDLGIIAGYPDGTFQPSRTLNRAEVAKIVVVATLGEQGEQMATWLKGAYSFPDVPADHWASGYIMLAKNLGIVGGYPDGTFKPLNNVTHIELVKMLVEAAGLEPAAVDWPLNYALPGIESGIVLEGVGVDVPLTRCEMAKMVAYTVHEVANPATGKTLGQSVFGESAIATLTVTASASHVGIGTAVTLAVEAMDADGNVVAVVPTFETSDTAKSAVSSAGVFVGAASGVYTVTAMANGTTAEVDITVFGAPAALKATPAAMTVPANETTKVAVTVEVVDANGHRVATSTMMVYMAYAAGGDNGAVAITVGEKAAVAGVATLEVQAKWLAEVTDTLEVTGWTGITKDTFQISSVDQVATSIKLVADPTAMVANEIEKGAVTATVLDQAGVKMATGVYDVTFAISGKGKLAGGTADKVVTTFAAVANVSVESIKGDPGAFTVTASSTGLTSASVTVNTYIAGSPAALMVTTTDVSGKADGADDLKVTVTVVDMWGQPTTGDVEFKITPDKGVWTLASSYEVDIRKDVVWQGHTAGTFTMTVTDVAGKLTGAAFTVTIVPGPADAVVLSPTLEFADLLLHITNPTTTFTAQLEDQFGNIVAEAGKDIEFKIWPYENNGSGNTGTATLNGAISPQTVKTDSAGKASAIFTAQAYVGDKYKVSAACDDGCPVATTNWVVISDTVPGSIGMTIQNFAEPPQNIPYIYANEGEVASLTITLKDSNGNVMVDDPHLLLIEFSNGGKHVNVVNWIGGLEDWPKDYAVPGGTLASGVWHIATEDGQVVIWFEGMMKGSFSIKVTAVGSATGVSASRSFATRAGNEIKGARVFNTDGTLAEKVAWTKNQPVQLWVAVVDNGGNALQVETNQTVWLWDAEGYGGEYRATAAGTEIESATIAAGQTYKAVYYVNGADAPAAGGDLSWDAYLPALMPE